MAVGFVGLGIMGSGMAARLQAAGFDLVVTNRTRQGRRAARRASAWADRPADVGKQVEVLFTMLADPTAVASRSRRCRRISGTAEAWCNLGGLQHHNPAFARKLAEQVSPSGFAFWMPRCWAARTRLRTVNSRSSSAAMRAHDVDACRPYFAAMGNEVKARGTRSGAGHVVQARVQLPLRSGRPDLLGGARLRRIHGLDRRTLLDT